VDYDEEFADDEVDALVLVCCVFDDSYDMGFD